jgi:hypothetical protein
VRRVEETDDLAATLPRKEGRGMGSIDGRLRRLEERGGGVCPECGGDEEATTTPTRSSG